MDNGTTSTSSTPSPPPPPPPEDAPILVETPYLIVGAGPAGASLACFLADHGHRGVLIAAAPGIARTPRAHITNAAGLECLRDLAGLEAACLQVATHGAASMQHTRWCASMAGAEYARVHSWGHAPHRVGDYAAASPCRHVDLPQTELEPLLTTRAVHGGWTLRWHTRLVSFTRGPGPDDDDDDEGKEGDKGKGMIVSEVYDEVLKQSYRIRSKYLFGCDGARSQVVRQLGLPLVRKPGQGLALNILVRADLAHLMAHRPGNLHWCFAPDRPYPPWGWAAIVRMVKPWTEWMFIMLPKPGADLSVDEFSPTPDECRPRVREMIGDDAVDVEILDVSKWWINEIVAEYYSDGNVYVHPPNQTTNHSPPAFYAFFFSSSSLLFVAIHC